MNIRIKCPNCGASHYEHKYSTCTAVYYPPIYKDGVNTNPDGNVTTNYCKCIKCNHNFYYTEQYGKVGDIVDEGEAPFVPTLNVPLTVPENVNSEPFTIEEVHEAPTLEVKTNFDKRIDELVEQVKDLTERVEKVEKIWKYTERLTKMVESLWKWNTHDVF